MRLVAVALDTLSIAQTGITDAGLAHLDAFTLKELSRYRNTNLTDAGMRHLEGQTELRSLMLRGVKLTADGVSRLRR